MRIVQKYGGTSLADAEKIRGAARRAVTLARQGNQVVMVVSAQGDMTDELIQKARELNPDCPAREMDACLAVGEQLSAALTAMAIRAMGMDAVSLTGPQAGILSDGVHGNARIRSIDTERILKELAGGNVVVVAGFQALGPGGDITTLGRGGSDTTAVALAAAMEADRCQIFTDVNGVYDRDPRRFPEAVKFSALDYEKMLDLIRDGAQVLHDRCVELAREKKITVEVLSAFTGEPGTLVKRME